MAPSDDQREGSLARRLSVRERTRRGNDYLNPLRRPRDRLYQELAERHRVIRLDRHEVVVLIARARAAAAVELKLEREEKLIRCTVVVCRRGIFVDTVIGD
jgi:hypothetical protein